MSLVYTSLKSLYTPDPGSDPVPDSAPRTRTGNAVIDLQLTNSDLLILSGLLLTVLVLFMMKLNGLERRVQILETLLRR